MGRSSLSFFNYQNLEFKSFSRLVGVARIFLNSDYLEFDSRFKWVGAAGRSPINLWFLLSSNSCFQPISLSFDPTDYSYHIFLSHVISFDFTSFCHMWCERFLHLNLLFSHFIGHRIFVPCDLRGFLIKILVSTFSFLHFIGHCDFCSLSDSGTSTRDNMLITYNQIPNDFKCQQILNKFRKHRFYHLLFANGNTKD